MKEIFRFFHKCFFALQKFKSFFILSIFFDALLQGIKLIEPWILASMLDSLYKNSKDVFLQAVCPGSNKCTIFNSMDKERAEEIRQICNKKNQICTDMITVESVTCVAQRVLSASCFSIS